MIGFFSSLALIGVAATGIEHLGRQAYQHWRLQRQLAAYRGWNRGQRIAEHTRALSIANGNHEHFERLFYLQCQAREDNPLFQTKVALYLKERVQEWGEPRHARNLGVILTSDLTVGDIYDFVDALTAEESAARDADRLT